MKTLLALLENQITLVLIVAAMLGFLTMSTILAMPADDLSTTGLSRSMSSLAAFWFVVIAFCDHVRKRRD